MSGNPVNARPLRERGKGGGKSKGKGKSSWKGGGKGSVKGKGKAFGGECWTCGEKGHRSNECPNLKPAQQSMEIGSVEKETNVGGVWTIAQVQAKVVEDEWKISRSRGNRRNDRTTVSAAEKLLTVKMKKHEKDVDDEKSDLKTADVSKVVSICTVSEAAAAGRVWRDYS